MFEYGQARSVNRGGGANVVEISLTEVKLSGLEFKQRKSIALGGVLSDRGLLVLSLHLSQSGWR